MKVFAKPLSDHKSTVFRVQTTFPNLEATEMKFGDYSASAFVHRSVLKNLKGLAPDSMLAIHTHRDVFMDGDKEVFGTMTFDKAEPAFKLAKFIKDQCKLHAGYKHGTPWEHNYRGKIDTRVIMISTRATIHEVEEMK